MFDRKICLNTPIKPLIVRWAEYLAMIKTNFLSWATTSSSLLQPITEKTSKYMQLFYRENYWLDRPFAPIEVRDWIHIQIENKSSLCPIAFQTVNPVSLISLWFLPAQWLPSKCKFFAREVSSNVSRAI